MACPICISPEGSAIAAGVRAGAGVLILATAIVVLLIGRFAWRLWALRPPDSPSPALAQDREKTA